MCGVHGVDAISGSGEPGVVQQRRVVFVIFEGFQSLDLALALVEYDLGRDAAHAVAQELVELA
jgi:hypothetical protein